MPCDARHSTGQHDCTPVVEEKDLLKLASRLASSFLAGHIDSETAALLANIFPGAVSVSFSILAGGKLLITEENLLRAGFVEVFFERADDTVAGQAIVFNTNHHATLPVEGQASFTDFRRAALRHGCFCMISAPISKRQRRASVDMNPFNQPLEKPQMRRNSTSSDSMLIPIAAALALQRKATRGPPLGSLTLGLPQQHQMNVMHLETLIDLAEMLVPLVDRYCSGLVDSLESLFCCPASVETEADSDTDISFKMAWSNEECVEEYVDALMCRQTSKVAHCDCKQLLPAAEADDGQDLANPTLDQTESNTVTACPLC